MRTPVIEGALVQSVDTATMDLFFFLCPSARLHIKGSGINKGSGRKDQNPPILIG